MAIIQLQAKLDYGRMKLVLFIFAYVWMILELSMKTKPMWIIYFTRSDKYINIQQIGKEKIFVDYILIGTMTKGK